MESTQEIVCGNRVHRPVMDGTLTAEDLRVAREELNETPETREIAVNTLKKMLMDQNGLTPRTDDEYLLQFLRCRKFNCERTFNFMRDLYAFRKKRPEVFPLPSELEAVLRKGIFGFLQHRDHKGRIVLVTRIGFWKPEEVSFSDFIAAGYMVAEYLLSNPVSQINGYTAIFDFKGFSLKHAMQFGYKNSSLAVTSLQERFPARLKIGYCVNTFSLITKMYQVLKYLIKEKFRERLKFIGYDMKNLHQYLDPRILPVEYGGERKLFDPDELTQRVLDREELFNHNRKFGFIS